jgi:hypothetical protein
MSRNVNVVILCEDPQHAAFAQRFLKCVGRGMRVLRVEISPQGRGSGEQYVRERFARELAFFRERKHRVEQALIVIIDADLRTLADRIEQFKQAAIAGGQKPRSDDERVAYFIPARNIETWLAYLDGQNVNEKDSYPRLEHARECQRHVNILHDICKQGMLRQPSPPSLEAACKEYRTRLR